jgi:fluoroquinolone transport system permease protein
MIHRHLFRMLGWDLILLHRNQLIVLSAVVAGLYVGLFYLLKPLGNLHTLLIVLLFNDPVVTGFLFAGVLYLMEKNQNTLQAIRIAPQPLAHFLLSKSLALAILSIFTAICMVLAAHGSDFRWVHLLGGVFLSALFFSFWGFYFGVYSRTFNHFLLFTIGFLVLMGIPFLSLFDVGYPAYYLPFPSYAGICLLQASLEELPGGQLLYGYVYLGLWVVLSWLMTLRAVKKSPL